MRLGNKGILLNVILIVVLFLTPNVCHAVLIEGDGALGDFAMDISYHATSSTTAILTVVLTNVSNIANGGFITAFAFNNPFDSISAVSLTASNPAFSLLGGASFNNGINGMPYGYFDIGASTGGNFEGGGNPNVGIGVGETGTFTFTLTGTDLDALTIDDFLSALSAQQGGSEGEFFAVRFRGFENDGSDKVPGEVPPPPIPEPSSFLLLATALGSFCFRRKFPRASFL